MDKEKMIEEMVKVMLVRDCPADDDLPCVLCKYNDKKCCNDYAHCENLVEAGYGHIPTAIREFAEKVKCELLDHYSGEVEGMKIAFTIVDELVYDYGK